MRWVPGILCCALGALLLFSDADGVGAQQGEVIGRVVDGETRLPIRNAFVLLEGTGHQTATDSLGGFRLSRVAPARYRLQVRHIAYSTQSSEVEVTAGTPLTIQIAITASALQLEPFTVNALTSDERRERGAGYRRSIVTRQEIELAENGDLQLGEMLRLNVPMVSVRRLERAGSPVCIELRTVRAGARRCLSPAVYLDGVPINDPTHLYDNLELRMIERLEVVPAAEAGVMYGSGALYGALLITTRRPGSATPSEERKVLAVRPPAFNWSQDSQRHNTLRVLATTVLGNGLGLAAGAGAASQCLALRKPAYDGLISDCNSVATVGTAVAAVVLPALASGFASRWSGRTNQSQGQIIPASMGTAMAILPGYALVFSGYRNDSPTLKGIGYGLIVAGAPLVTTAADYLFRELRGKDPE